MPAPRAEMAYHDCDKPYTPEGCGLTSKTSLTCLTANPSGAAAAGVLVSVNQKFPRTRIPVDKKSLD